MDNIDDLVDSICEPGSQFWSGENSDLDGQWIIYPDPKKIAKAIRKAIATARAEALKLAADRATEYLFRHGTYMSTACYEAGNLRRAIMADKQEGNDHGPVNLNDEEPDDLSFLRKGKT